MDDHDSRYNWALKHTDGKGLVEEAQSELSQITELKKTERSNKGKEKEPMDLREKVKERGQETQSVPQ